MALIQILSNEAMNDKGFIVKSDSIDWSRYLQNPILILQHEGWDEPLGNVIDIHRNGNDWLGTLLFADTSKGRKYKELYENGTLRAVSIGGISSKVKDEMTGVISTTKFLIYEISLVNIPSNAEAISDFEKQELNTSFYEMSEDQVTQLTSINNSINKQKKKIMADETKKSQDMSSINAVKDGVMEGLQSFFSSKEKKEKKDKEEADKLASEELEIQKRIDERASEMMAEKLESEKLESERIQLEKETAEKLSYEAKDATIYDKTPEQLKTANTQITMSTTYSDFLASDQGNAIFTSLSSATANRQESYGSEQTEGLRLDAIALLSNMLADPHYMAFAGGKSPINVTYGDSREKLSTKISRVCNELTTLSSGANSQTFITDTPDLAVIMWSSLIYYRLFPSNRWAGRAAYVSAEVDGAGVIWINSTNNPAIYMGRVAPINATNYMNDNQPHGLIMKRFSIQPQLWQPFNLQQLNFDAVGLDQYESMNKFTDYAHNYMLQRFFEEAKDTYTMTGATNTITVGPGTFPLNPLATGNVHGLTADDLFGVEALLGNYNYDLDRNGAELVLPYAYIRTLKKDEQVTNILYNKVAGSREVSPNYLEFSGFKIDGRSKVSLWNTATTTAIDAEAYLDGKVDENGSIPTYTPPVIPATAYDSGLVFMPQQAVIARGTTNIHVVNDPNNYGWKISMDMGVGASAGRPDGQGLVRIVTDVVTP